MRSIVRNVVIIAGLGLLGALRGWSNYGFAWYHNVLSFLTGQPVVWFALVFVMAWAYGVRRGGVAALLGVVLAALSSGGVAYLLAGGSVEETTVWTLVIPAVLALCGGTVTVMVGLLARRYKYGFVALIIAVAVVGRVYPPQLRVEMSEVYLAVLAVGVVAFLASVSVYQLQNFRTEK